MGTLDKERKQIPLFCQIQSMNLMVLMDNFLRLSKYTLFYAVKSHFLPLLKHYMTLWTLLFKMLQNFQKPLTLSVGLNLRCRQKRLLIWALHFGEHTYQKQIKGTNTFTKEHMDNAAHGTLLPVLAGYDLVLQTSSPISETIQAPEKYFSHLSPYVLIKTGDCIWTPWRFVGCPFANIRNGQCFC